MLLYFYYWRKRDYWIRIFTKFFDYCIRMESLKIINLLDQDEDDPRFETRKWYIIHDHVNGKYGLDDDVQSTLNLIQKL